MSVSPLDVLIILLLGVTALIGVKKNKLEYLAMAVIFMIVYLFAINTQV